MAEKPAPAHIQIHRNLLRKIHDLRMKKHWGKNYDTSSDPWPQSESDWRQVPHGAPWDTNVMMAEWHLEFARTLFAEEIFTEKGIECPNNQTA